MPTKGLSIAGRLAASKNRPSGFDYLRIVLSVGIIAWHTILVCYGERAEMPFLAGPTRPLIYALVPSFFALSGFLVAGSLERNRLPQFITLRVLRIVPALSVEVFLSAFLVGPLVTTLSLRAYFSDPEFGAYFFNIVGYIHYVLPGVFESLPAGHLVNGQLWTVPFELECYVVLTLIVLSGLNRRLFLFLGLIVGLPFLITAVGVAFSGFPSFYVTPPGRLLVLAFLAGVVIHGLRHRIPHSRALFAGAVVAYVACIMHPDGVYLTALPIAYITVYLGLLNPRRNILIAGADYSYGVYIYGFPCQQLLSFLLPDYRYWYVNMAGGLVLSGVFAWLSWTLVEARVLNNRHAVLALVSRLELRLREVARAIPWRGYRIAAAGEGVDKS